MRNAGSSCKDFILEGFLGGYVQVFEHFAANVLLRLSVISEIGHAELPISEPLQQLVVVQHFRLSGTFGRCLNHDLVGSESLNFYFIDLILGLTQQDPEKRLSLAAVKKHPWMKGETATPDEVRNHFYSLSSDRKLLDKEHYEAM